MSDFNFIMSQIDQLELKLKTQTELNEQLERRVRELEIKANGFEDVQREHGGAIRQSTDILQRVVDSVLRNEEEKID